MRKHRAQKPSCGALFIAVIVVLSGLLSGCVSPTSAFAPSATGCFATLPKANSAVGPRAILLGVRLLSETTINNDLSRRGETPIPAGDFPASQRLCLVGYKGPFEARRVTSPWPPSRLHALAALVVFSPNRRRVLYTVLVDRLPLRLSRI